jgi:hypothetical protein
MFYGEVDAGDSFMDVGPQLPNRKRLARNPSQECFRCTLHTSLRLQHLYICMKSAGNQQEYNHKSYYA